MKLKMTLDELINTMEPQVRKDKALNKEIGQDHFLYGKKIWAVAKCESNDDVLYVLRNGTGRDIYYLFHLTYSAHNTDGFPRYEEFADLFAVKEFIERSYIEDYM